MIQVKFTKKNLAIDKYGSPTFAMGEQGRQFVENMDDGVYVAEIKKHREKRSLDANAYAWVLLNKLAMRLESTKELLYQRFIREKSPKIDFVAVKDGAVESLIKGWEKNGLGWFGIVDGDAKGIKGCKRVMLTYGSSAFNSKEMSVFIDWIIEECKEQGIETLTPDEVNKLKENWK